MRQCMGDFKFDFLQSSCMFMKANNILFIIFQTVIFENKHEFNTHLPLKGGG